MFEQNLQRLRRQKIDSFYYFSSWSATKREKKQNNKTVILDKLKESIMSEEVDSKSVEDL